MCSGVKNFNLISFKMLLTGSFMLCPVVQWISAAASQCHYFCPECQVSSSYYFFSIFSNTVSPIKNVLWKVFRKRPNQGLYSWQDKSIKIFFSSDKCASVPGDSKEFCFNQILCNKKCRYTNTSVGDNQILLKLIWLVPGSCRSKLCEEN